MDRRTLLSALAAGAAFGAAKPRPLMAQGSATVGPLESGRPVGIADAVAGEAAAILNGSRRSLAQTDPILFDDLLQTGAASRLRVLFDDRTELTLGENANVLIDRYLYDPQAGRGAILNQVLGGAFQFVTGAIGDLSDREVTLITTHANLGIRGTRLWGGLLDGRYEVFVFDGEVDIRNSGGTVTLRAGDGAPIDTPFGRPGAVVQWAQPKIDRALATVAL